MTGSVISSVTGSVISSLRDSESITQETYSATGFKMRICRYDVMFHMYVVNDTSVRCTPRVYVERPFVSSHQLCIFERSVYVY